MKKTLIALTAALTLAIAGTAFAGDCSSKDETTASTAVDANLAQVILTVSDATCGSCVHPIRKELTTLAGVHKVEGSEADYKNVIVWLKPGSVTDEQLIAAVKKAGYTATVKQEDARQS